MAWRRHPDTFFGVLGQRSTRADTPLALYDFFHEWFKYTRKSGDGCATGAEGSSRNPRPEPLASF
jgi:hypothetical protein